MINIVRHFLVFAEVAKGGVLAEVAKENVLVEGARENVFAKVTNEKYSTKHGELGVLVGDFFHLHRLQRFHLFKSHGFRASVDKLFVPWGEVVGEGRGNLVTNRSCFSLLCWPAST